MNQHCIAPSQVLALLLVIYLLQLSEFYTTGAGNWKSDSSSASPVEFILLLQVNLWVQKRRGREPNSTW